MPSARLHRPRIAQLVCCGGIGTPELELFIKIVRPQLKVQVLTSATRWRSLNVRGNPVHATTAFDYEPVANRNSVFQENTRVRPVRARDRKIPGNLLNRPVQKRELERYEFIQFLFDVAQIRSKHQLPRIAATPN